MNDMLEHIVGMLLVMTLFITIIGSIVIADLELILKAIKKLDKEQPK